MPPIVFMHPHNDTNAATANVIAINRLIMVRSSG
jgi:hypothetical protein